MELLAPYIKMGPRSTKFGPEERRQRTRKRKRGECTATSTTENWKRETYEKNTKKKKKKKKMMMMAMTSSSMLIKRLLILLIPSVAFSVDDKCPACNAVAEELERGLSNARSIKSFFLMIFMAFVVGSYDAFSREKPWNHLDMRHRLDSTGQRRGKLIDYRVSELRVVELLYGLCDKMQDYTLQKVEPTRREWIKVDNWDNLTNKQEARAYSKDISTYCGRLLEETEDEFAELIKEGSVKVGDVSKVLCQDLSEHCSKTR